MRGRCFLCSSHHSNESMFSVGYGCESGIGCSGSVDRRLAARRTVERIGRRGGPSAISLSRSSTLPGTSKPVRLFVGIRI